MFKAGVVAPVPLAMIRYFEESRLKFYGYGSRFNTPTGSGDSDWDMLVVCTDEEWTTLKAGLGLWCYTWTCGRWQGYKPEQPVFCNYRHDCYNGGKKNKNSICVRKIEDPEIDLYCKGLPPKPSDYTEIILPP
jgi:hypothetical protein